VLALNITDKFGSGGREAKAAACKAVYRGFESHPLLYA